MFSFILLWFVVSVLLGTLVGHCISAMETDKNTARRFRGERQHDFSGIAPIEGAM